ncbi:SOS response-associated peptidase [Ensifer aridi]|uniref:SOS response-associated peptidase n=1 Tax=Ensifer aridi TaxID=1708715 RepID=UPI000415D2A6|nr:SOS response-associated peptidase family protein [Ensifer aridi]
MSAARAPRDWRTSFSAFKGAPSLALLRNHYRRRGADPDAFGPTFVSARWGLIPGWIKEQRPGKPPPVDARCEGISTNGMFKKACASRRCLIPIDGFFEWKDIFGHGQEQAADASATKSGEPFALAGIWEGLRNPATGEDIRIFCVVTCPPNEMMPTIHAPHRFILHREDYERWLSPQPNPYNLMKPFPAELMTAWPIHRKVDSPKNDIRHPRSPEPAE